MWTCCSALRARKFAFSLAFEVSTAISVIGMRSLAVSSKINFGRQKHRPATKRRCGAPAAEQRFIYIVVENRAMT